jgi:UDP-3-O-[3-hydroxymyristoyl] glucosamine N-acyltransferase
MHAFSLKEVAGKIGAQLHLAGQDTENTLIHSLATLGKASVGQISFLSNSKYRSQLAVTQAQAVILSPENLEHCSTTALVMANPYVGFALVAQLLDTTPRAAENVADSASIAASAKLGLNATVGANAVIESGAEIGEGAEIGPGCFVGKDAVIGAFTKLWANVTIYHKVRLGQHCLIQSGTVIGSDGFGYANDRGKWIKIPQLGTVIIGDRVEIGASTTIDRGALDDTIIGNGVIIDNQCQIAHNVVIGDNTAMAACSVIAGTTHMGRNCSIAGLVGINGHLEIVDNVHFTGMTMVTKSIKEPGLYSSGMPATNNKEWRKNAVALRNVDSLNQRIKALEKLSLK